MTNSFPTSFVPGLPPFLQQPQTSVNIVPISSPNGRPDNTSQLKEFWFRNATMPLPLIYYSEENKQRLVPHKYPNLNNQRLENTGFDGRKWKVIIPLCNSLTPKAGETWKPNLYDKYYNQFTIFLQDGTSGKLQLPDKQVIAKVVSWTQEYTGQGIRDGALITVNFEECLDDNLSILSSVSSISTLASLATSGQQITKIFNANPSLLPPGFISTQVNHMIQLASYTRQLVATPNNVIGSINSVIQQITSNISGLVNAANAPASYILALETTYKNIQPTTSYNTAFGVYNAVKYTQFGVITPPTSNNFVLQPDALVAVHTAYQSTFQGANNNLQQHLNKSIHYTNALLNFYVGLNSIYTLPLQTALLSFLSTLQILQSTTNNTNAQGIYSFVNFNPLSFVAVARYTNNNIDDIMKLNYQLSNTLIIPIYSTIRYRSQTGR